MITYCASCGIANRAGDARCQACNHRLRKPTSEEQVNSLAPDTSSEPEPVYIQAERKRWARSACQALLSAALLSMSRALLMPFLITHVPRGTFGSIDSQAIQQHGYFAAVGFLIAAAWAQRDPLVPTVAALSLYLGLAVPDALDGTTLLSRGIISKTVMVLVLLRALNAAIRYRTTRKRPAFAALHG
jgi:hypothetical protein